MKFFNFDLTLFGEDDMGGEEMPELTPQATGDRSIPDAGENHENARKEAFRRMMEGEYKDLFQAFFQETFNRRFKEQKGMLEELQRARDVVAAAREHYGVTGEQELVAAIRAEKERNASADPAETGLDFGDTVSRAVMEERIQEAVKAAVLQTRKETEQAVTNSIRARGMRPIESALTPGGAAAGRFGASRLSRADRADMARRAAKGERIEF
ncbi:MAG: hypothetical protein IKC75_05050 [Clostridia bacterium]|nr:hypothetical protein [Clostridia bacterium]